MAKKTAALLPVSEELLRRFGERLRLARLRRRLTAAQVAERAGMAPLTLRGIERGGSGTTIGAYLAVMQVLGIEQDLESLAKGDPLGRELQDSRLRVRSETTTPRKPLAVAGASRTAPSPDRQGRDWASDRFADSSDLAGLVKKTRPTGRKKR